MYSAIQRQQMLATAHDAIQHGLNLGTRIVLQHEHINADLFYPQACFVTLKIDNNLRGCIGTLTSAKPLIENIAYYAYSAAFEDPRFNRLAYDELAQLETEISILGKSQKMAFSSEQDLLQQLTPYTDGLIVRERDHCATFLPSVWQQLPEPATFLQHLKDKMGLPGNYWSDTISVERYSVISVTTK